MRRREFITLIGGAAAAYPLAAHAQQGERMRRIGVLIGAPETDPETKRRIAALVDNLRQFGWVEGRNVQFDYRISTEIARMRGFASAIVDLAPDIIVVHSNPFLANLRQVNRTIPAVFVQIADPVNSGFVESLARPGGNLTGFTNFEAEIGGKWIELLKEAAPNLARALVLLHQDAPANVAMMRAAEAAAPSSRMTVTPAGVQNAPDIEGAINAFAQEPNGGVIVVPHTVMGPHLRLVGELLGRHRLPSMFPFRFWMATSGGMMSYGIDVVDLFRRSAVYIDRILRGTKASDLPVQNPTKYELAINLKTAKALGLTVPPLLLARADEVIE